MISNLVSGNRPAEQITLSLVTSHFTDALELLPAGMAPYFPKKPLKLDYIYFHVGRLTIFWADTEDAVDACLDVFSRALPAPLYQRPMSTRRRIVAFRRFLPKLRLSDAQRRRGKELIDRFANLRDHRHWLTHGVTWNDTCASKFEWHRRVVLVDDWRSGILTDVEAFIEGEFADRRGLLDATFGHFLAIDRKSSR